MFEVIFTSCASRKLFSVLVNASFLLSLWAACNKCQFAGLAICRIGNLPNWQFAEMSISRNVTLPKCKFAEMYICRNVNLPNRQFAEMFISRNAICRNANFTKFQLAKMLIDFLRNFNLWIDFQRSLWAIQASQHSTFGSSTWDRYHLPSSDSDGWWNGAYWLGLNSQRWWSPTSVAIDHWWAGSGSRHWSFPSLPRVN